MAVTPPDLATLPEEKCRRAKASQWFHQCLADGIPHEDLVTQTKSLLGPTEFKLWAWEDAQKHGLVVG